MCTKVSLRYVGSLRIGNDIAFEIYKITVFLFQNWLHFAKSKWSLELPELRYCLFIVFTDLKDLNFGFMLYKRDLTCASEPE